MNLNKFQTHMLRVYQGYSHCPECGQNAALALDLILRFGSTTREIVIGDESEKDQMDCEYARAIWGKETADDE